jgi:hypothetical protein
MGAMDSIHDLLTALVAVGAAATFALMGWAGHQR